MLGIKRLTDRLLPQKFTFYLYSRFDRVTSYLYLGTSYECPCCGGTFRRMKRFGVARRPNARCPRCGALERHRLIRLYLTERRELFHQGTRLLHFAPELCLFDVFSKMDEVDYLPADISSPLAAVKVDITDLPFEDNSFDAIICSHVLEHVRDDHSAMGELRRVLKTGGWAVVMCPVDTALDRTMEGSSEMFSAERARLFGADNHLRRYGSDFADRLSRAGFDAVVDSFARQLEDMAVRRFALSREEDIYFCTKPVGAEP